LHFHEEQSGFFWLALCKEIIDFFKAAVIEHVIPSVLCHAYRKTGVNSLGTAKDWYRTNFFIILIILDD
jgi:hypothetical protein